jgi:hypothetical protein
MENKKPRLYGKAATLHQLLWVAGALSALAAGSIIMVSLSRDAEQQVTSDRMLLLIALGTYIGIVCVSSVAGALLLRAGNPLARVFGLASAIMLILFMPFGTLISVFTFLTLASRDTSQYFASVRAFRQSTGGSPDGSGMPAAGREG